MRPSEIDYANIPVQADAISEILRLDVESDDCFRELENLVSSDLGVATLVMRVVNSPFYGHGNKIANIPRAISVLGFNVVRSLAILAFSRSMFSKARHHLFQQHVWQHSLLTAIAGQAICAALGDEKDGDEAFIAGLIHDMGKALLLNHQPQGYLDVLSLVLDRGVASITAERQIFGCDHLEVGREAAHRWRLPERFIDFMGVDLSVPRPEFSGDPVLQSLAAANRLIGSNGFGARAVDDIELKRSALTAFGLDASLCDQWLREEFMAGLMDNDTYRLCANL